MHSQVQSLTKKCSIKYIEWNKKHEFRYGMLTQSIDVEVQ